MKDNAVDQAAFDGGTAIASACETIAETLRVIAHPARMQMLIRLAEQERSVAWLAEDASIQPHAASSHLRLMQRQGVVKGIRRGKFVCYRIIDPNVRALVRSLQPWLGK